MALFCFSFLKNSCFMPSDERMKIRVVKTEDTNQKDDNNTVADRDEKHDWY